MSNIFLPFSTLVVAAVVIIIVHGECDLGLCQYNFPENSAKAEQCKLVRESISCAQSKLLNNSDCNEDMKRGVKNNITEGRKFLNDECRGGAGGATVLVSSLCLNFGLAGLTYIMTLVI